MISEDQRCQWDLTLFLEDQEGREVEIEVRKREKRGGNGKGLLNTSTFSMCSKR